MNISFRSLLSVGRQYLNEFELSIPELLPQQRSHRVRDSVLFVLRRSLAHGEMPLPEMLAAEAPVRFATLCWRSCPEWQSPLGLWPPAGRDDLACN